MAEPLTFQALASSDYVLSSAENYILYVLLEAIAGAGGGAGGGSRLPLNLGVVIDRSGSMYDERRLEFVIEAVKFLAGNVAPEDKVAVVAFADRAKLILAAQTRFMTAPRWRARLKTSICWKSAAGPRWRSGCKPPSTRSARTIRRSASTASWC